VSEANFILYNEGDNGPRLLVRLEDETVWLTQAQMAELFQTTPQNITQHIRSVYAEGELDRDPTCKDFLQVRQEGQRQVQRNLAHYNLDVIISVGYRVKSHVGTQFRIWATQRLREFLVKGFVLDDQRLKDQATVADYFDELLERIRDIRSSEKLLYKRVRDICALSVDYDPKLEPETRFFAITQNKFHFAVTGMTAAEIVRTRADAAKPNMGAQTWSGEVVRKKDVATAKNYLLHEEIDTLNRLVAQFLEFAELQAKRKLEIRMADWLGKLDQILKLNGFSVLQDAGRVSARISEEHAHEQYALFEARRQAEKERELEARPDGVAELAEETKGLETRRKKRQDSSP
jgi:hypothetical protein